MRAAILAEDDLVPLPSYIGMGLDRIFELGDPPDYEPAPEASIAAEAGRLGRAPYDLLYDMLLRREGHELLMRPLLGYSDLDHGPHPRDAPAPGHGAGRRRRRRPRERDLRRQHARPTCSPTGSATAPGAPKLPIETVVHKMTKNNADLYGFADRGVIAPGLRADLNVIDLDRLTLHAPEFRHDLPSGAPRLVQEAEGYVATWWRAP